MSGVDVAGSKTAGSVVEPKQSVDMDSEFHSLFQPLLDSSSKSKTRSSERSRLRLRVHKNRSRYHYDLLMRHGLPGSSCSSRRSASKLEPSSLSAVIGSPFLQVNHNPSSFSVYAAIRQTVLENKLRRDSVQFNGTTSAPGSSSPVKHGIDDSYDDDDNDSDKKSTNIPKVVGMGLTVIFELISESRKTNPALCCKSLKALLDTLQAQVPESMRREPTDLMDSLFNMLLTLSTSLPECDESHQNISSLASACLLSLVVAIGDTGKMLKAVSSLITSKKYQEMETPMILGMMQKSVDRLIESNSQNSIIISLPMDNLCDGLNMNPPLLLLSSLRSLTKAHLLGLAVVEEENVRIRGCNRDDFSPVCRFESHGGGWGYSGHSIEAIRFSADTDILCGGFGLFGGRGEYVARIRLYDIGNEGGEHEEEGKLLAESDKIPFECPARHKYSILFDEPVHLQANRWYVAWAMISGPSSDCGSQGQFVVNAGSGDDQVTFFFKSSKKSNNGTDVNSGQIPTILYKLITPADLDSALVSSNQEHQPVLSREFAFAVSVDCFTSLLSLLSWSWNSFRHVHSELKTSSSNITTELKHLAYVSCVSLHLLKVYVNETFPNSLVKGKSALMSSNNGDNNLTKISECVADTRTLMMKILKDADLTESELVNQILTDCSDAFMSCYHAFYPSASLRWKGLCDLLLGNYSSKNEKLLSAVLSSLCFQPFVRLTFPLNQSIDLSVSSSATSRDADLSPSEDQPSTLQPESATDSILIEKMMERECISDSNITPSLGCFRYVLNRLLTIIGQPIEVLLGNSRDSIGSELVIITCKLLTCILNELVSQSIGVGSEAAKPAGEKILCTPSRFTRVLQNRTWNTGNGSPDAICFSADRRIFVAGVTLYGGVGNEWHYELEILEYQTSCGSFDSGGQHWLTVEVTRGTYTLDESKANDVCEVKFDHAVPIKAGCKYAIRLKNHGSRTNNGDGGLAQVCGPDGTIFTFSDCLLSLNGTNQKRGQIPQILYHPVSDGGSNDGRAFDQIPSRKKFLKLYIPTRNVLSIGEAVFNLAHDLLSQAITSGDLEILNEVSKSHLICILLPSVLSHLIPLASKDPKCAILIVMMVRKLLPLVSQINQLSLEGRQRSENITSSSHCVVVESEHPYKPASVCNYRVKFGSTVKWMTLEFDPRCGTAQPEDSLQLYIPSLNRVKFLSSQSSPVSSSSTSNIDCDILHTSDYWPVRKRMTGQASTSNSWPNRAIVLPGNEVIFSLETASDYLKDEKSCYYGFRVHVTGFDSPANVSGFPMLEQELTYVGVTCLYNLLNKDMPVASNPSPSKVADSENVSSDPVIQPAAWNNLKSLVKISSQESTDSQDASQAPIRELAKIPATVSRWLQPESYVDPDNCEVECCSSLGSGPIKCNWPVFITITMRDQYKNVVHAPGLKIDVSAQPIHCTSTEESKSSHKGSTTKEQNANSLSHGFSVSCLTVPYTPTIKDKIRYHSICMMQAYESYSPEELRFAFHSTRKSAEEVIVRDNRDGTFTASWTPTAIGWYQVTVTIDGEVLPGSQCIHVTESPKGITASAPPHPNAFQMIKSTEANQLASNHTTPKEPKTRKFVGKDSAGLRVRSLPSLQSAQIGLIGRGDVISFLEEMKNDDGIWVRLTPESIKKYCDQISNEMSNDPEAWALQYNQHYWQSLLVPTDSIADEDDNENEDMTSVRPIDYIQQNGRDVEPVIQLPIDRRSRIRNEEKRNRKKYKRQESSDSRDSGSLDTAFPCSFQVIKSGPSGHNIRSRPCLTSPSVGVCILGNIITATTETVTQEGTWLKLTDDSKRRYCFNKDSDAWVLATSGKVLYLQPQTEFLQVDDSSADVNEVKHKSKNPQTSPELVISRRNFALQSLTWFLRNVTQPVCLHDILWSFVSAFSPEYNIFLGKNFYRSPKGEQIPSCGHQHAISSSFDKGTIIVSSCDEEAEISVASVNDLNSKMISVSASNCLSKTFHSFLQAVSDLIPSLPSGSPLLQIAVTCFSLKFHHDDHQFLHDCGIFSNMSRILSRLHHDVEEGDVSSSTSVVNPNLEVLSDVTMMFDLKTSSRQAMISCLTDRSTETFWESGDEDRNKTKIITGSLTNHNVKSKALYVHIDNCRDVGAKCTHIVVKCSELVDPTSSSSFIKIKSQKIDCRFTGWITAIIPDPLNVKSVKIEFKGPDNTLRVRHITILGSKLDAQPSKPVPTVKEIHRLNCEEQTLRVFQSLTHQVFGKLIYAREEASEDLTAVNNASHSLPDATDISNFTALQKQVCSHVLQALDEEVKRFRQEWESSLLTPLSSNRTMTASDDAYCFSMLSLLRCLCRTNIGRSYLSTQDQLILNSLSLLHTGSSRMQGHVVSLIRELIPNISPAQLASILNVKILPVGEQVGCGSRRGSWSDFDPFEVGLLDILFSCIAKALTVQTKVKGSSSSSTLSTSSSNSPYHAAATVSKNISSVTLATSILSKDDVKDRWFMRGSMSKFTAELVITLLKDMSCGKMSDIWCTIVKDSISENILNLTRLREEYRSPSECMKTGTLWLALSSLCVMDQGIAERISNWIPNSRSGKNSEQQQRPFCSNHDDNETLAIIHCNVCGNLCPDCDRFLHLHRRTKTHQRQIFKEEEEAIKVDLHEGCGRSKLFWLMSLADSRTLKAKVEFRGENLQRSKGQLVSMTHGDDHRLMITGVCRFCGATGGKGLLEIGNVCGEIECQVNSLKACSKIHPCGHMCGGIKDETTCLPCLHRCADTGNTGSDLSSVSALKQDADDMCMICFTDALSASPAIQLKCGHVFHYSCCVDVLMKKWPGPRITFTFSQCPICKSDIDHPVLQDLLKPIRSLYEDVKRKALMRLEYEGLDRSDAITLPSGKFFSDPLSFAMERYAYYVCCKCSKAYFGGEARCDAADVGHDAHEYDPNELVCGACSDVSRAQMCPKHGTDFLEYKCRYCCSVAVFFCFGTTHFCNSCHDDFRRVTNISKKDLPKCPAGPAARQLMGECPLHVDHPETGEEFALGCGVCRNAHTF